MEYQKECAIAPANDGNDDHLILTLADGQILDAQLKETAKGPILICCGKKWSKKPNGKT